MNIVNVTNYEEIKCPHCGTQQDYTDSLKHLVSYWGEDGEQRFTCEGDCGKDFFINENVSRDWDVGKTAKDFDW